MEKKSLYDLIMTEPKKGCAKVDDSDSIVESEFIPQELENGFVVYTHTKPDFNPDEHQEINP